ncbi:MULTISPECIES: DUF4097 family beta strand repeat-containing protein [Campylobacter]|uniref:DUF4097 family beta strand repeat-containing protein n=1 Tax=Campylobacter TaxID=194 RepID=UPI000A3508CD|nr:MULTISPECIES: DUF4097 family beta strand repeat-containing protein [unclassified Campylobacter]
MNKTFNFAGSSIKANFAIQMDIEILQTTEQNAYIKFESNSDQIIVEHTENSLTISSKIDDKISSNINNINSLSDLFVFALKVGIKSQDIKGIAKIFIPQNNNSSLNLKANNADIISDAKINSLNLNINNGDITIKNSINDLDAKSNNCDFNIQGDTKNLKIDSNNGNIDITSDIENLDIKSNNSNISLTGNNKINNWIIKMNNGTIKINKKDFDGTIYHKENIINSGSGQGIIKIIGSNIIEIK